MKIDTEIFKERIQALIFLGAFLGVAYHYNFLLVTIIVLVVGAGLLMIIGMLGPDQSMVIGTDTARWAWKDAHDNIVQVLAAAKNEDREVFNTRFLLHINAITDADQPIPKRLGEAIELKMLYEYKRKYGTMQYSAKQGPSPITALETLRRLSDEERVEFIGFWEEHLLVDYYPTRKQTAKAQ